MLAELRLFRLTDGLVFDVAVSSASAGSPRAIVVRTPISEMPQVAAHLRALGARPVLVANRESDLALSIPQSTYGITRRVVLADGNERLIRLPADALMPELLPRQLTDGSLSPQALKGLVAIVAPPRAVDPPRFSTSGIGDSPALSAADFKARAVHALQTGRVAVEVTGLARMMVLVLAALVLPLAMLAVPPRRHASVSLLLIALSLAAGLLLVIVAGILIPTTELALLAALAGGMAARRAREERDRRLALLADRAGTYAGRNSLISDPRRWIDFFPAAARLTGVESSLLLQMNAAREFEVKAAFGPRASEGASDLVRSEEFKKADAHRPSPVVVEYLPGWANGRIARLDTAGDHATYWLYAPPEGEEGDAVLAAAERLARRTAAQPALATPSQRARQRHPLDVRLSGALTAMISRAGELRGSLAALQTATMLFDAAGSPLLVNAAMERLLPIAGLQPARATPVDVAVALAGMTAEEARAMLGELVRHGGELRLRSNARIGPRCFAIRVTETSGDLLFEAIDVTDLDRLASIQTELAGEIDARIRNDLEAIELATKLATDERLPAERRERALTMISQATQRTRSTLDDLGRLVDSSIYVSEEEPYPVNPRSAVIQAAAAAKPLADKAGVTIELRLPAFTALVLAEPGLLDGLLRAMLEVPLGDSPRSALVQASLSEGAEECVLTVTGGFGLPSDRLATMLSSENGNAPAPVRVLRLAQLRVNAWGGSLEASSDAGQGYRFTLRLKKS